MSRELSRNLVINTLWSFIGRFGYLAVSLITNIILVRLLSPKEFGQVSIMMFFIVVATVLTESGLGGALIRKQNVTEVDYSTIFIFNLCVSIFLMVLLIASSGFIASSYQDDELQGILIAASIVLLINAFKITQTTKLIKELQFKKKAVYEFVAVLLASAVAIFLAYQGLGVWSLVALQLLTALILTVLLWALVGPLKTYKFSKDSFIGFYKFGVNTTLASLLNAAFDNVYQLILGKYFSISQAGYFYQAKRLQEIPSGIFIMISKGVIYSSLARLQESADEFNALYQRVVIFFTVVVALISMLIFYYSDVVILLLYGKDWIISAYYMQLLVIGSFFYVQEMFNRNIFKVFDRTEKILQLEIVKKTIQGCTIFYGVWSLSIENLLYGFVVTSITSFLINYFYARKIQNYFRWKDFFTLIKIILAVIFSIVISSYFAELYSLNTFENLWLLPLLLMLYLLFLYMFRVSGIFYEAKKIMYTVVKRNGRS